MPGPSRQETVVGPATAGEGELRWTLRIDDRPIDLWLTTDLPVVPPTDAAVPAALVAAMSQRVPFRISDPVDPVLLANLDAIQDFYVSERASWEIYRQAPDRVEIRARTAPPVELSADRGVAAFFSSGIDSFQLALDAPDITHLIRIVGFDLATDQPKLERALAEQSARAAALLGKPLVTVRTNVRQILFDYSSWHGSYGAALATVALALSPSFRRIYIASGPPDSSGRTDGSDPRLDHLWGGGLVQTVRFGGGQTRADKLVRIAESKAATTCLRVCPDESGEVADNCGRCFKCLRALVLLEALGLRDRFTTFPPVLDLGRIAETDVHPLYAEDYASEPMEAEFRANPNPDLRHAFERYVFGDWARRNRGSVERRRRPSPASVLALVDSPERDDARAALGLLEAMRRQDERTLSRLVATSTPEFPAGELELPPGVSDAAWLAELADAELASFARAADLILCAGWDAAGQASLAGEGAQLVGVFTEAPTTAELPRLDAYLASSRRLGHTLVNLGIAADSIAPLAIAPTVMPETPVHARGLVRSKSARAPSEDEPLRLLAPAGGLVRGRLESALGALGHGFDLRMLDRSAGPSERAAALENADALVTIDEGGPELVLVAEAMAFACVVIAVDHPGLDLIDDGVSGLLIDPRLGPGERAVAASDHVFAVRASPTGCRSMRAAAVQSATGRDWFAPARALLDRLGESPRQATLTAAGAAG